MAANVKRVVQPIGCAENTVAGCSLCFTLVQPGLRVIKCRPNSACRCKRVICDSSIGRRATACISPHEEYPGRLVASLDDTYKYRSLAHNHASCATKYHVLLPSYVSEVSRAGRRPHRQGHIITNSWPTIDACFRSHYLLHIVFSVQLIWNASICPVKIFAHPSVYPLWDEIYQVATTTIY